MANEQLGIAAKFAGEKSFVGEMDVAVARLQINSNLRSELKLKPRNMRSVLMKIPAGELLDSLMT